MRLRDGLTRQNCSHRIRLVIDGYDIHHEQNNDEYIWCEKNIEYNNFWWSVYLYDIESHVHQIYAVDYYFECLNDAIAFKMVWKQ